MKKTGLIGIGVISKYILYGLEFSNFLKLVSFCDIDAKKETEIEDENISFFDDYIEMIRKEKLNYVIISTPPSTHYEIIKKCLNEDVNVIVEKPAVLDLREWDELVELAKKKNLVLEVIYHWQNGAEVKQFLKETDLKGLKKISVSANDPYSEDRKTAISDRVRLGGSWIDSGVNILSLLKLFLPFNSFKILKVDNVICEKYNIPIASKVNLIIDDVIVDINIDWRNNLNQKITKLKFDDTEVVLHHTDQSIIYENETKQCSSYSRLGTHYKNYFARFNGKSDLESGRKIHELLLEVRDCYEKNRKVLY